MYKFFFRSRMPGKQEQTSDLFTETNHLVTKKFKFNLFVNFELKHCIANSNSNLFVIFSPPAHQSTKNASENFNCKQIFKIKKQ